MVMGVLRSDNLLAGLLNIMPQWLVILNTVDRFCRLDRVPARLLLPLATWAALARVLNFEIWRLNG
jgi:benzodiazapine receptor